MTGTSNFIFGNEPASLMLMAKCVVNARRTGHKTAVTTEKFAGFVLHTLHVTAPEHESRKERGLLCH